MKGAGIEKGTGFRKRALIGIPALMLGAAAISSAATQFVAYRVGYHPALGAAWIGHIYAPWSWVQWQEAPWAVHAETTFRIVDSALMAIATLGMLAVMCISRLGDGGRSGMRACTEPRASRPNSRSAGTAYCLAAGTPAPVPILAAG